MLVIWDWPCTSLGVQLLHVLHGCHGAVVRLGLGWGQLELKEHLLFKNMKYYTILKYLKKKRVAGHKNDIKYHNPGSDEHKAGTRLPRHCGGMKLKWIPYTTEWSILKRTNGAFNPRRNISQLCFMEKYLIMFNPDDATRKPEVRVFRSLPSQCPAPFG